MREIEFRGYDGRGNVFFGAYNQNMGVIDDFEYASCHAVDYAEQLCGRDKNGRKVYENDILIDDLGQEHIAEIYDKPNYLATLTLKEKTNEISS